MASIQESKTQEIVKLIADSLSGRQYAIRGTASIYLQGFDMNVDDVDVIGDKNTALYCNLIFREFLTDKVALKETEKFKSYFGKFVIADVLVEVYGNWQIKIKNQTPRFGGRKSKIKNGVWSEVFDASEDEITEIDVQGKKVKATKMTTELKMFALMGRWNAYWKLKKQLTKSQRSLF